MVKKKRLANLPVMVKVGGTGIYWNQRKKVMFRARWRYRLRRKVTKSVRHPTVAKRPRNTSKRTTAPMPIRKASIHNTPIRFLPGLIRSVRHQPVPKLRNRAIVAKETEPPKPKEIDIESYSSTEVLTVPSPKIDSNVPNLQWPSLLQPIFAISLRGPRYVALLNRMARWSSYMQVVPGTDGRKIDRDHWSHAGRLSASNLTNGQIGCYESHVRVWRRIVDHNLAHALILEDDVDIKYTQETVDKLNEAVAELSSIPDWDIVFLGNESALRGHLRFPPKRQRTPHLIELSDWEVLHMYLISNRCARRFLQDAFPIRMPVDVFMGSVFSKHNIVALGMVPSIAWVVPNESDTTRNI